MVHTRLNIRTLLQKERYGGYWLRISTLMGFCCKLSGACFVTFYKSTKKTRRKNNFEFLYGVTERRSITKCFHCRFEFTPTSVSVSIHSVDFQTSCLLFPVKKKLPVETLLCFYRDMKFKGTSIYYGNKNWRRVFGLLFRTRPKFYMCFSYLIEMQIVFCLLCETTHEILSSFKALKL